LADRSRPKRVARVAEVLRRTQLTPHMIRVVFGGEGLRGFPVGEFTDHYVKLQFPPPGAGYAVPYDVETVQRELPREQWPVSRTYTVRSWDAVAGELTIDFVHHGDEGVAGPWAAAAQPGDRLQLFGPGGAYAPSVLADWHLLVGDEAALPAIAAALPRVPSGAQARVFLEVAGPEEEQDLPVAPGVELHWVHRGSAVPGEALVAAVRSAQLPTGTAQAFVHGEAHLVRELRSLVRVDLAVPRELMSVSGYWRLGSTEDRWQAEKRDWNAAIEAQEQVAAR